MSVKRAWPDQLPWHTGQTNQNKQLSSKLPQNESEERMHCKNCSLCYCFTKWQYWRYHKKIWWHQPSSWVMAPSVLATCLINSRAALVRNCFFWQISRLQYYVLWQCFIVSQFKFLSRLEFLLLLFPVSFGSSPSWSCYHFHMEWEEDFLFLRRPIRSALLFRRREMWSGIFGVFIKAMTLTSFWKVNREGERWKN